MVSLLLSGQSCDVCAPQSPGTYQAAHIRWMLIIIPYIQIKVHQFTINVIYDGMLRFKMEEQGTAAKKRLDVPAFEGRNMSFYVGDFP